MSPARISLPEGSLNAHQVDFAFFTVLAIALAIFLVLFALLVIFAIRYRKGSNAKRGPLPKLLQREIEIGWTAGTIFLAIFIFWWFVGGLGLPPRATPNQLEIHVAAKQWMWKTQQPNGAREIDALHVPVGRQVRLVMTSQDVIHSFYVPAFRLKQDVLPARTTELIFTPTKTGRYHLFCAEYCGTQHSRMAGQVIVMSQKEYSAWLQTQPHSQTVAQEGEALFASFGCGACHAPTSRVKAPKLAGLYGSTVVLSDGRRVEADDAYLEQSILRPRDEVVSGYQPIMPSYAAFASQSQIDALVAYIKTMAKGSPG